MAVGTHRLLLGAACCCLILGSSGTLGAHERGYSTIQPVHENLKAAVYPFTMPFTNLVEMTRWNWEGHAACGPGGCGDAACAHAGCARLCCPCGPDGRFWARADYLVWWTRGGHVPALVTTGSPTDPVPGALDQPNTQILFGDRAFNGGARSGYRIQLGSWLGDCRRWAVQGDWFDLGQRTARFSEASAGAPLLARPFFDVLRQLEAVHMIAFPEFAEGDIDARVSTGFHSAGANLRRNLYCHFSDLGATEGGQVTLGAGNPPCRRLDLFAGYRHYALNDRVTVRTHSTVDDTQFDIRDSFRSRNEFHGGEIGLIAERFHGRWSLELLAKLAMGNNRQTVTIDGETAIRVPGQDGVFHFASHPGGLLALPNTNMGTHERDRFALIPQFGFELGYQLTHRSRVYMGYDVVLWWHVARAGDHIDTRVNTAFIPPPEPTQAPALPEFAWDNTTFWAQGLNFGWEFRY